MAIDLITISREVGSGGSDLALELSRRLGWRLLDSQLVDLVADRLRCEPRTVAAMDEQPPTLFARMVSVALMIQPPELLYPLDASEAIGS